MKTIRESSVPEIEKHLISLGAGNHEDNMREVRKHRYHWLAELSESNFRNLVFLQRPDLAQIVPNGQDRTLEAVAKRALKLPEGERKLATNWDIERLYAKTNSFLSAPTSQSLPAILLRDARGGELDWAPGGWYIQDGSHRALGYLIAILDGLTSYESLSAYCATNRSWATSRSDRDSRGLFVG